MLKCDFEFSYQQFHLKAQFEMHDQVLAIVGASGSGKSTVLKNIVGLLQPQHGEICFNDRVLFDHQNHIDIAVHQRRIALVFQNPLLFPHLNVRQNLKYAEQLVGNVQRKFSFEDVVELFELRNLLKRRSNQLSGGEAQRVSIGRALLSSPDLLLLDEPLTGLDARLKNQILPFLKMLKDQTHLPMIYVTHHLDEVDFLQAHTMTMTSGYLQDFNKRSNSH
ncbi:ATP-binding cassette domain-containing protein [Acinetobacter rathckeae]|uniref:ATP-binding cassette domain-containing protein n=1 Tax=Acinetobacter rathckeae TaxID=2605272 RepID=UPI0018A30BA8|nr:ATP-binding cassette domain-containing protein [Acinetobacter rathckeae]MBF7687308.1 ATP-binding cassette domain-containing protein [Acinetobacter rathckeae]MBF7696161.1 ATP-binding cassette domain-containing protein [Acinetobacter rathckeae]